MIGSDLPRYSQPRPTIGPAESSKSQRTLEHLPVVNLASDAVAPHDPTMLEIMGLDPQDLTNQYIKAIRDFIRVGHESDGSYAKMVAITGSKVMLTKYAPTVAERYEPLKKAVAL